MFSKKNYIFLILYLKREFPLYKYFIVVLFIIILFRVVFNSETIFIEPGKDVSYLLKVVGVPTRGKVGEIKFKAKVLGELKNHENKIELKVDRENLFFYCQAIELPWKNISDLNKQSLVIGRGDLLKVDSGSGFSKFLALKGFNGFFKIKFISLVENPHKVSYLDFFNNILDKLFISSEVKALYKAMLFGDKTGLSIKIESTFRDLGLSHLLVVSGFHIGLFFFTSSYVLLNFLRLFGFVKNYISLNILANLFSLFVTFLYCLLVGLKASCVRALLSIFCFVLYRNLGYKTSFFHLLSIYLLVFCIYNFNLFSALSVQYTFLALIGIMYASFFEIKNKLSNYFLVSLFACSFTSLLTLSVFDTYNFLSILTNAIFSPILIVLICKIGLFLVFLSLVSVELAMFLAKAVEYLIHKIFYALEYIMLIDYFKIEAPGFGIKVYFLSFFLIFIFLNYYFIKQYRLKYNI